MKITIVLSKIIFLLLSLIFFLSSIRLISNHIFQFSPNKISVELSATVIFSSFSILFCILFFFLFYFLHKRNVKFFPIYWITLIIWISAQLIIIIPYSTTIDSLSILFFFIFDFLPILYGIYMMINKKSIFTMESRE